MGKLLRKMKAEDLATAKDRMRKRLKADGDGSLTLGARANAVKGRTVG